MIRHEAVGMDLDAVDSGYLAHQLQERRAMGLRTEDEATARATVHDVVPGAVELYAQRSRQFRSTHRTRRIEPY